MHCQSTHSRWFFLCFLLLGLGACVAPPRSAFRQFTRQEGRKFDIWIKNGLVLNGVDTTARLADMLIRGNKILYVGPVDGWMVKAKRTIDAKGKLVTPGFIDTHAHGDPLETPEFHNFLAQGVTTICLGQDGDSPEEDLSRWMKRVDSTRLGVNLAMFAGHGTLRQLSGIGYEPIPSPEQQRKLEQLLQHAFDAGFFGLSTGLEYIPGLYAAEAELMGLAKVVGQNGGLLTSHMRNEDDDAIEASLRELLRQGQYCNVQASHLKVVFGKGPERAERILALMDSARQAGRYAVTADVYPYTASFTGIGIVFPTWAKPPNDYDSVKVHRRQELLDFLHQKVISRNGPEATLFGTQPYAGKTLAEVAREQGKPFEEVLLDIGPGGASAAYFVMNEDLQSRLLADPHVMVCSDGSPTMRHPRGYGSFSRIMETYVLERQLFPLAEAVRKMTSLSAQTIGLPDRGKLAPGYKADILVFDPSRIKTNATFTDPFQLSAGMDWVLVNGHPALEQGQFSGQRYGHLLKKGTIVK